MAATNCLGAGHSEIAKFRPGNEEGRGSASALYPNEEEGDRMTQVQPSVGAPVEAVVEAVVDPGICEIEVTSNKTNRTCSFIKNFGGTLPGAQALFPDEAIYSLFEDAAVIRAQSKSRGVLDKPENSIEQAVKAGEEYMPGVTTRRAGGGGSAMNRILSGIAAGTIPREQVLQLITMLQQSAEKAPVVATPAAAPVVPPAVKHETPPVGKGQRK